MSLERVRPDTHDLLAVDVLGDIDIRVSGRTVVRLQAGNVHFLLTDLLYVKAGRHRISVIGRERISREIGLEIAVRRTEDVDLITDTDEILHAVGIDIALKVNLGEVIAGEERPAADLLYRGGDRDRCDIQISECKAADLLDALADDDLLDTSIRIVAAAACAKEIITEFHHSVTAKRIGDHDGLKLFIVIE